MKYSVTLFFLFFSSILVAQFSLQIKGSTPAETAIIDSTKYKKKHTLVAEIIKEQKKIEQQLQQKGFLNIQLLSQTKTTDSSFVFTYKLGKAIQQIQITTSHLSDYEKNILAITSDTISSSIANVEKWMNNKLLVAEKKGYTLAKLKLIDIQSDKQSLKAKLHVTLTQKRTFDNLVILGYDNFPKNIKHNWNKRLKNRTFNKQLIEEITSMVNELNFAIQKRPSEILFTKKTTQVYTYLEKNKPNKFEGFVGFANNETTNKLAFTGYLDFNLINIFNAGEKNYFYWKNDGNKQTSFKIATEIPYLFKTPLGTSANLKIFKQDSIFQTTQFNLNLAYYLQYNKKITIGYKSKTSANTQQTSTTNLINDFTGIFFTAGFSYTKKDATQYLFPKKMAFHFKTGIGNRTVLTTKTQQFFTEFEAFYNFYLTPKNSIAIRNETFYLDSNTYLTNELYRFGGITSIRGFRENSLQASFYSVMALEYRYLLSPTLYVNTISDYGYFQDKTTQLNNTLLGLGFGFGLLTKNGLFKLVYANGSVKNQAIKLSDAMVQINFTTTF